MTSHSVQLRAKIELALPAFHAVTRRLWSSDGLRERYAEYLCTMHAIIRATVPIMETALARAEARAATDPVARGVADYLRRHVREEAGHDEWVRQDLAAIGADPDEPLRRLPTPAVAALVGSQYYWVNHYHPVCLLGHIGVLEGYPPDPALADLIVDRTGFPPEGVRTLRRHAALDQRHRDELMAAIDGLPLQARHAAAMGVSALHSVRSLIPIFEELLERVPAPLAAGGR